MNLIHEPILGDIPLSDNALKIIDHPYFDRSHHIYQVGTAYRIYPSATHSRKIHMIGTYGITLKLLNHLSEYTHIDNHIKELISLGALVHDIGHASGSHLFDKYILPKFVEDNILPKNHDWLTHENRSKILFRIIGKEINLSHKDIEFVCEVIDPSENNSSKWEFSLVNNKQHGIDTDKLDYIVRDSYMLGLKLNIDISQIIQHSRIIDNKWAFSKNIQDELFNVFFVRYRLHRILTQPKIIKFDLSYRNIILKSNDLKNEIIHTFLNKDIPGFVKLTDSYILHAGDPKYIKEYYKRTTYKCIATNEEEEEDEDDEKIENQNKNEIDRNSIEDVSVAINICKKNNNAMANIVFFNPKTNKRCLIKKNILDDKLPSIENLSYVFKFQNCQFENV